MACTIRGVEMTESAAKPKRRRVNDPRNHVPTEPARQAVKAMVITGIPLTRVASALGMDGGTLRRHYRAEIDESADKANTAVISNLYRIATGKTPQAMPAAIFWAKTKLGWRETSKVEATVEGGGGALIVYSGCLKAHDETI
jgi:hypothetical protein